MRRFAVMIAISLALSGACTERLLLVPSDQPDAGSGGASGTGGSGGGGGGPIGSGGRSTGSGGFILTGGTFGSGGRQGSGGSGMPNPCGGGTRTELFYDIHRAQVVLAVGRNSTMQMPFGNGGTRLTAVQQVVRSAVMDKDEAINFAYLDFPTLNTCSNGTSCCTGTVILPIPNNFYAIDTAMTDCNPFTPTPQLGCTSSSNGRPIADAMRKILATPNPILMGPTMSERRVILMIDGAPSCSSEDASLSCENAVSQIAELRRNNVRVHVLPIGIDVDKEDCLKRIAAGDAGATPSMPFTYRAQNPNDLAQSFNSIIDSAAQGACEIVLTSFPSDPRAVISLEIRKRTVAYDTADGWSFSAGAQTTIEVHGNACRDLQHVNDGEVHVWACQ